MRKILYFIMGLGILSFFSCTQSSQYALEKFIESENVGLPLYVNEHVSYDSVVLHEKEGNVTMYYSIDNDLDVLVESIKNQDTTAMKNMMITSLQNDPVTRTFLLLMEKANYYMGVEYLNTKGEVIQKYTIGKEEYSKKIDSSQIENNRINQIINEVNSAKSLCPIKFDERITWSDVLLDLDQKKIVYVYEIHDENISDKNVFYENMSQKMESIVSGPSLDLFKEANFTIVFQYVTESDTMNFTYTPEDYN